jgi:uncharacterized protein involved in exopolysaccharide biosynthesis
LARVDITVIEEQTAGATGFDLLRTISVLKAGWRTIMALTLGCVLLAIGFLHIVTPLYTSTMMLSPTQSQNQDIAGGLSALGAIAGISIGKDQSASPFALFPYVLNSRPVAEDIVRHSPDIMPTIFFSQWNAEEGRWREPVGIVHWIAGLAKVILGFSNPAWEPPGAAELQQYIQDNVTVETSTQKPVITLTYRNRDRAFAAHFLQMVDESTDRTLRRITLNRASKYASYLQQKLKTAQLTELRQVMMQSLSQQETLIMMGNSDTPFAAQPIGAAASTTRPTFPNGPIVLVLSIVIGLIAGSAAVLSEIDFLQFPFGRPRNAGGEHT